MPANDVFPHRVATVVSIAWNPWEIDHGNGWEPLPDRFEGWDSGVDVLVRCGVTIDALEAHRETGVSIHDMALCLSWQSSSTGMTGAALPVAVDPSGNTMLTARLAGDELSGVVTFRRTLTANKVAHPPEPGAATMPGAVLASDEARLLLDDAAAMFPVAELDFAHTRLSPSASWHLESSTEFDRPFIAEFRLLLNTRDTELRLAVERGARDRRQEALLDALESGVAELLVELAVLHRDDLESRSSWAPGSVGELLQVLLHSPGVDAVRRAVAAGEPPERRRALDGGTRAIGKGRAFQ